MVAVKKKMRTGAGDIMHIPYSRMFWASSEKAEWPCLNPRLRGSRQAN